MDIHELAAREQIRELKARYCRYVDRKQWRELRQLFAPRASMRFHGADGELLYRFDDPDAFIATTAGALGGARSIHQVHNAEITLTSPTTASAIWSMEDRIECPPGQDGPFKTLHGFGHYHEILEQVDGAWRIASIDLIRTILHIT